ncbi:hypothetical protein LN533_20895 [Xanthomonas vesicatoria]|uniref:hypothetical protein n=1 Tax=Xanthomonas vesicatoria TaxID=56460 RepID=UPI000A85421F|nr:hypothetical protein [Xanthomonas vesicatoria]MCC8704637.1 hypothetical protein [Xanthomonas vesicatoria]
MTTSDAVRDCLPPFRRCRKGGPVWVWRLGGYDNGIAQPVVAVKDCAVTDGDRYAAHR